MLAVYKPRAIAVIAGKFRPEERLVFIGDGTAAVYAGSKVVRRIAYLQPNPELMYLANETLPEAIRSITFGPTQ